MIDKQIEGRVFFYFLGGGQGAGGAGGAGIDHAVRLLLGQQLPAAQHHQLGSCQSLIVLVWTLKIFSLSCWQAFSQSLSKALRIMFDKPKHCDLLTFNFNFFQFFFPVFFKFFWGLASISNRTLSWGLNEEYIPSSTMSSNANYCEETKHKINACSSGNKQTNRKRWNK